MLNEKETLINQLHNQIVALCKVEGTKRPLQGTKRSLLKLTAKIFDPLGLLSPFVIKFKILFQELCIQKIDWRVYVGYLGRFIIN